MQKLLGLAVAAVIMAVSVNGTDEQLWLNEIAFQAEGDEEENPVVKEISLEIAMRPAEEEVFEDGEVVLTSTNVTAQFYTISEYLCPVTDEEPNMVSDDDCPQKPESDCPQLITVARQRVAENPWNGTWFGSETFTFKCPLAAIGAVKLTSGLSSATRVYCWGDEAYPQLGFGPDEAQAICETVVRDDEAQVMKPVVQDDGEPTEPVMEPVSYAMVNEGDHWGVEEGDFKWVKYEDGDEKQLMSLDVPNNCTSGSTCDESRIVQTLGYFAFASSIKSSFAVVMGASLATLFTVSIAMG